MGKEAMSKKSNTSRGQNELVGKVDLASGSRTVAAGGKVTYSQRVDQKLAGDLLSVEHGPDILDEEVELVVEEDRKRLILEAVVLLVLNLALLFVAVGCVGAVQVSGNVLYLAGALVAVAVVWFVSKRMGRFFGKYLRRLDACVFLSRHVVIFESSDPKDALVVAYKDIKNYKSIRQGKALRLLLAGNWVTHPSGFYFVDINRPFITDTLDELEMRIAQVMRSHRVSERN